MLLRTSSISSSSILKSSSWTTRFHDSISEPDPFLPLLRSKSVLKPTTLSCSGGEPEEKKRAPTQTQPDKNKTRLPNPTARQDDRGGPGRNQVLTNTGLGGAVGGGGAACPSGVCDSDREIDRAHAYYRRMVAANPGNSLVLGNYARFLKEIRGDLDKAEEYCERAILGNPSDGGALSMYGDIIWETRKDAKRAQTYFDRAVKAAPQDCCVLASYARFLWDVEDDDWGGEEGGLHIN